METLVWPTGPTGRFANIRSIEILGHKATHFRVPIRGLLPLRFSLLLLVLDSTLSMCGHFCHHLLQSSSNMVSTSIFHLLASPYAHVLISFPLFIYGTLPMLQNCLSYMRINLLDTLHWICTLYSFAINDYHCHLQNFKKPIQSIYAHLHIW